MSTSGDVLQLHRELIEIPSVSHNEKEIADFVEARLEMSTSCVWRVGDNVLASGSAMPRLLFNSHLDTVPPTESWTKPPFVATCEDGRVYGLGSNDTKGSVAAMIVAFQTLIRSGFTDVGIMLVPEEETGGKGTETAWPFAQSELSWNPEGILVGEPTEMQIGASQSGLLVLELVAQGVAAHAANAERNAIFDLSRDLLLIEQAGGQATVLTGSNARNQVPAEARAVVDFRTAPGVEHDDLIAAVRKQCTSHVEVRSQRLGPIACPPGSRLIQSIETACSGSKTFHSKTMSDLVFFQGCDAVKIGPGVSARSHTSDEFIYESEVVNAVQAYVDIAKEFLK